MIFLIQENEALMNEILILLNVFHFLERKKKYYK